MYSLTRRRPRRASRVLGVLGVLGVLSGRVRVGDGVAERLEHPVELVEADGAEPQHPARGGGGVDDGRGLAARRRTGVDDHLDLLAQHLLGLGGLGRGRAAGQVGRADRERAGALEDLQGDRVVGHPHRDRAAGVAEVPLQRGVGVADQGQRAGPELLDQGSGPRRDPDRQRVEGGGRRDQDRRRHVAAAALGVEQPLDRVLVEGVRGQAVDGVGRQHHEASALDGQAGGLDRGLALLVGGGRVAHAVLRWPIVPAERW